MVRHLKLTFFVNFVYPVSEAKMTENDCLVLGLMRLKIQMEDGIEAADYNKHTFGYFLKRYISLFNVSILTLRVT
jgi:hypothetical protein